MLNKSYRTQSSGRLILELLCQTVFNQNSKDQKLDLFKSIRSTSSFLSKNLMDLTKSLIISGCIQYDLITIEENYQSHLIEKLANLQSLKLRDFNFSEQKKIRESIGGNYEIIVLDNCENIHELNWNTIKASKLKFINCGISSELLNDLPIDIVELTIKESYQFDSFSLSNLKRFRSLKSLTLDLEDQEINVSPDDIGSLKLTRLTLGCHGSNIENNLRLSFVSDPKCLKTLKVYLYLGDKIIFSNIQALEVISQLDRDFIKKVVEGKAVLEFPPLVSNHFGDLLARNVHKEIERRREFHLQTIPGMRTF
jgi:hypothetical protein